MSKLKNLMPLIKKNFPSGVKLPILGEYTSTMNREDLNYELQYSIWGSDTVSGIAHFGKTEDVLKIIPKIQNYISKIKSCSFNEEYYILWTVGDYSLLNFYNKQQDNLDNLYPILDNLLCVSFGSSCDDDILILVLDEKKYITDINQWSFEGNLVNLNNNNQAFLLKKMNEFIISIDNSQLKYY